MIKAFWVAAITVIAFVNLSKAAEMSCRELLNHCNPAMDQQCVSILQGVMQTRNPQICITSASLSGLSAIVIHYTSIHPELKKDSAWECTEEAYKRAFPCSSSQIPSSSHETASKLLPSWIHEKRAWDKYLGGGTNIVISTEICDLQELRQSFPFAAVFGYPTGGYPNPKGHEKQAACWRWEDGTVAYQTSNPEDQIHQVAFDGWDDFTDAWYRENWPHSVPY